MKYKKKDGAPLPLPEIRLHVDAALLEGAAIALTAMQSNYLLNVMRLRNGDEVLVFNGIEGEWLAAITQDRRGAGALCAKRQTRPQTYGPDIHYLFAPLKRAKLDYVVQKAVEMGAAALRPIITRRTIAERINQERMRANAIEAAEQCGILQLPEIRAQETLAAALQDWDESRPLIFCDEAAPTASPLDALRAIAPGPMAVLIGPEGGFDDAERGMLRSYAFVHALSLGPRILRADTAAVAALALINAVLGDWGANEK